MVYTGYLLSERGFSGDILQCVARNNCIFIQLLTMCSIIKLNFQTGYTNKAKVFEANHPFGYQLLVHPQIHKRNFHAIDQKKMFSDPRKKIYKKISQFTTTNTFKEFNKTTCCTFQTKSTIVTFMSF